MPAIPKPPKRQKNKGTVEYEAFKQSVLASLFDRAGKTCMVHRTPEGEYLPIHCAVCHEPGLIAKLPSGKYHMSLDLGHKIARSHEPKLVKDPDNVEPQCRSCNRKHPKGGIDKPPQEGKISS